MKRLIALTFLVLFLVAEIRSQSDKQNLPPLNFGLFGSFSANILGIDLKWLNVHGTLEAEKSYSKFLNGFAFGGIFNVPIANNIFFSGRAAYNYGFGNFNYDFYDQLTQTITTYEDAVDFNFSYIEIMPAVKFYSLIPEVKNLYFLGGIEFGYILSTEFVNNQTLASGEVPNVNPRFAIAVGVGHTFEIADNIFLSPEFSFRFPVTKLSDNVYSSAFGLSINEIFSFSQLRFGASLTFGLEEKKRKIVEPVDLDAKVGFRQVVALNESGNEFPFKTIRVEDTRYKEYFPIVPYIFFEENSAIPASNTQNTLSSVEAGEFIPQNLPFDALEVNRRTLDIIGWRLKKYPNAELTIIGTTDKSKNERANKQLAKQRADFVRDYLVKTWKINPERLNVRTVDYPSKPSTDRVPEGVAENRRAELSSSSPDILDPLLIEGENQRLAEPSVIKFEPYAQVYDSIRYWEISIYQGDNVLKQYSGTGEPKTLHWHIKPNELVPRNVPIDYRLKVETIGGKIYRDVGSIPTEYYSQTRKKAENLPDRTVTKFSLVLFDFDKAEVSPQDQATIRKLIIPEIKYNSTVKIYGYTDRIGEFDYNLDLSIRRAEAVKAIIQRERKDVKIETFGVGERNLLFDNEIPTGRHLSRTVQVVIVTPR
ncbi:MAG: OmpA family protein [Ignavibacteria bacterium]|nr:OmpA family protein [Ignavibacteria bacterium]